METRGTVRSKQKKRTFSAASNRSRSSAAFSFSSNFLVDRQRDNELLLSRIKNILIKDIKKRISTQIFVPGKLS